MARIDLWTPDEDERLREAYLHNRHDSGALAQASRSLPRRSRNSILRRATVLGLTKARERYRWSQEELDALEKMAHLSLETIQRRLAPLAPPGVRRTQAAIVQHIHDNRFRTNLSGMNHTQLSEALGMAISSLHKYRIEGLIEGYRLESLDVSRPRAMSFEHQRWFYSNAAIRRFIYRNPGLINLARVSKHWFIDLLRDGKCEKGIQSDREKMYRGKKRDTNTVFPVQGVYPS
jgi:hypothetical protein